MPVKTERNPGASSGSDAVEESADCPAYRAVVATALPTGSMCQLFSVTDPTFGRE
jgi:hypothetical protein